VTLGLRRYARPAQTAGAGVPDRPAQRCEMCGVELGGPHGHVVALDERALRCVCRPCHLLFAPTGAGARRIRAVPERYLTDPAHRLADEDWDLLQIPALPVFVFVNSDLDRAVACYPSPAGVTESTLELDGWTRLERTYPLMRALAVDVEAVYVTRTGDGLEAYLVPIDACFAVAGTVRLHWRGPDGGEAVRQAMTAFVHDLRARSRPLSRTPAVTREG